MNTVLTNIITVLIFAFIIACLCIIPAIIYRFKINRHPVSEKKAYKLSGYICCISVIITSTLLAFFSKKPNLAINISICTAAISYFIDNFILNNGYKNNYYARLDSLDSSFKDFIDVLQDIRHDIDKIRLDNYSITDEKLRIDRNEKINKISYIINRFPDVINEFYNDFNCIAAKVIKIRCDPSDFDYEYNSIIFLYETSQKYLVEKYRTQIKKLGGTIDEKDYGDIR